MASIRSSLAGHTLRWSLTLMVGGVALQVATPARAASPIIDPSLPPMARTLVERTSMATVPGVGRFEPAPTPNQNVTAPRPPAVTGTVVSPTMFRPASTYRGDGYTHGSSQQVTQEPRRMPLPGISLTVPLN